jgi:hypothetical protein
MFISKLFLFSTGVFFSNNDGSLFAVYLHKMCNVYFTWLTCFFGGLIICTDLYCTAYLHCYAHFS